MTPDTDPDWYANYRREVERNKRERDRWEAAYRLLIGSEQRPYPVGAPPSDF